MGGGEQIPPPTSRPVHLPPKTLPVSKSWPEQSAAAARRKVQRFFSAHNRLSVAWEWQFNCLPRALHFSSSFIEIIFIFSCRLPHLPAQALMGAAGIGAHISVLTRLLGRLREKAQTDWGFWGNGPPWTRSVTQTRVGHLLKLTEGMDLHLETFCLCFLARGCCFSAVTPGSFLVMGFWFYLQLLTLGVKKPARGVLGIIFLLQWSLDTFTATFAELFPSI